MTSASGEIDRGVPTTLLRRARAGASALPTPRRIAPVDRANLADGRRGVVRGARTADERDKLRLYRADSVP